MQKLLNHSKCAALISTHFHNLVEEIPPALATPMHMSAIVDEAAASVTFLYKLVQGCRCVTTIHSTIYFALILHAAANLSVFTVPRLRGCLSQSSQVRARFHVCPLSDTVAFLPAGARSRLEQLQSSTARGSLSDAAHLMRQIFEEKDPVKLLQVIKLSRCCIIVLLTLFSQLQKNVRALAALSTGNYGRDLLVSA